MKGSSTSPPPFGWDDWYASVGGRSIHIAEVAAILHNQTIPGGPTKSPAPTHRPHHPQTLVSPPQIIFLKYASFPPSATSPYPTVSIASMSAATRQ